MVTIMFHSLQRLDRFSKSALQWQNTLTRESVELRKITFSCPSKLIVGRTLEILIGC